MSTGKPHPGASTPILTFECHAFERPQYEIRVNGPYLGLLASVWAHGTISVWEWRSGLLQSVSAVFRNSFDTMELTHCYEENVIK